MDNFHEEIVVKKNRTLNNLLFAILNVLMVLFALIAAFLLSTIMAGFTIYALVMLLVSGGMAFLIFWKRDALRTEYEYTFTNGELDFARVLGNNKRKNLGSMRVRNVEALGYVSGKNFNRYVSMPGIEKSNWFLNRDANLFYFYYNKDSKRRIIVIEPTDEMVKMIKQYAAHGAYQD
ncbi:MAG: hypothetical protein LBS72_07530 [Oscillospiraceae bacterium]|nr:hypothetical protein [Oscillospiraceae bacterium]